jgi:hypothetical protein
MKKIMAITLFLCVFFIGCDDGEPDYSIGEITITDIPSEIKVANSEESNPTFKVYLYASNSQSAGELPVAKGLKKVEDNMKQKDGTYTIKIQFQQPDTVNGQNPNTENAPWRGTAYFFSIMISPQKAKSVDYICAKGGLTLNKGKATYSWNNNSLLDLSNNSIYDEKKQALFNDIIKVDSDINTSSE